MPGALVCKHHGAGAPQVEQAAQVSAFVDAVAAVGPPRPVWQVLLSACALADQRMRESGDADSIKLAAGIASESIKSRAAEMQAEAASGESVDDETADRIVTAVEQVVQPVLAEVGGRRHDDVSAWVGPAVAAALRGQPVPPLPPRVPDAVVPAAPVRRVVAAIGPSRQNRPGAPESAYLGDRTRTVLEAAHEPPQGRTSAPESQACNSAPEDEWSTAAGEREWLARNGFTGAPGGMGTPLLRRNQE